MSNLKMKVGTVRENYENRDAFYTLAPLNCVLRMFGFNCIYRYGKMLKHDWYVPKITFLVLLFSVMSAFNLYNQFVIWKGSISFSFDDAVYVVFLCGYVQYLIDIYYVYKYGRDHTVQYYCVYENIDKILGVTYYSETRKCIMTLMFYFTTIVFVTAVAEFTTWFISFGGSVIFAYVIDYLFVIIRNLSFADLIAQVVQVSFRVRAMADLLEEFYFLSDTLPGVKDILAENRYTKTDLIKIKGIKRMDFVKTISQYEFVIMEYSRCYLMILEQCDYINTMYGVRILATCFVILLDMTIGLNLAIRIIMGSFVATYDTSIFPAISSILRVLACAVVLCYEASKCEESYGQMKRIIRYIDYLLVNKKISSNTRGTLMNFRSLVTSRPVQFHARNVYNLDSALLLSAGSAVLTHTVILLQNIH